MEGSISVEQLDALCVEFIEAKAEKKRLETVAKDQEKVCKKIERKILTEFERHDKTNNAGLWGRVTVVNATYFKVLDKEKAYEWLKNRGDFDALATVNAKTLSSHVKGIVEQKKEEGDFTWVPPGMEDSSADSQYLRINTP